MLFSSVNLADELDKEKSSHTEDTQKLVTEAEQLLEEERKKEERMLTEAAEDGHELPAYDTSSLENERIFSIRDIRQICIKYRLRFLDFKHFRGNLPYEAVSEMKALEKRLHRPLNGLKVVAPSSLFELTDKDSDPLLMLNLGDGQYYLIHKWGKDLIWYRKWISYPFRSLTHYIVTIVLAAFLFAQSVPIGSLPDVDSVGVFSIYRLYLFAFVLISFCSLSVFLLFALRKNFNDQEWKNSYI